MSDITFLGLGVPIDPEAEVKQAFMLMGKRWIPESDARRSPAALAEAKDDLGNKAAQWLVGKRFFKWRTEPEWEQERDFVSGNYVVGYYARGWLDEPVKLKDHQTIVVEL